MNKKSFFGFGICVHTVPNLERYRHKCQIFGTFETLAVRCFLVFGVPHAKYLAFGTPDGDALMLFRSNLVPIIVKY